MIGQQGASSAYGSFRPLTGSDIVRARQRELLLRMLIPLAAILVTNALLWIYTGSGNYVLSDEQSSNSRYYSLLRYACMPAFLMLVPYGLWRRDIHRAAGPLFVLAVFWCVTTIWSPGGLTGGVRSLYVAVLQAFIGVAIVTGCTSVQQVAMRALALGGGLVWINVAFAAALPGLAADHGGFGGEYAGALRGIYPSKNVFGANIAIALMFTIAARSLLPRGRARNWATATVIAGFASLALSRSATAIGIACLFVAIAQVLMVLTDPRRDAFQRAVLGVVGAGVLLLGALLAAFFLDMVFKSFGRDLTFTGRTDIWALVVHYWQKSPWYGYGYMGFWNARGEAIELVMKLGYSIAQAHNGYLESMLWGGILGLIATLTCLFAVIMRAVQLLRRANTDLERRAGAISIGAIVSQMVYNCFESSFYYPMRLVLALLMFCLLLQTSLASGMLRQNRADRPNSAP